MQPLPLRIPLPSIQRCDIKTITKVLAEILTEDTAKLLDRLAGYAAWMEQSACGRWSCLDDAYVADEAAALAFAGQIRKLLRGRNG